MHPILSPGWDRSSRSVALGSSSFLWVPGRGQGGDTLGVCVQMHTGREPRGVPGLVRPQAEICSPSLVTWGCTLSVLRSPVGWLHEELGSGPGVEQRLHER